MTCRVLRRPLSSEDVELALSKFPEAFNGEATVSLTVLVNKGVVSARTHQRIKDAPTFSDERGRLLSEAVIASGKSEELLEVLRVKENDFVLRVIEFAASCPCEE